VYGGEHFDGLGVFGGGVHRDPPGDTRAVIAEKTLHQLRHSRLTHLGEANVSAPLLMAISGHKGLAILQRYVKPGQAAVAALMASSDPDRRGR
jgi:integrase/recombinase XerC/integrase/recombinase XerD